MIPFKNRFHGHNSLMYVYKNGQANRSHSMILRSAPNSHRQESRFAVVVSKKTLKSAVRRNLIRRRVYEVIRGILPKLSGVFDIVIIVSTSELINLTPQELREQITQLFDQAGLLKSPADVSKHQ